MVARALLLYVIAGLVWVICNVLQCSCYTVTNGSE